MVKDICEIIFNYTFSSKIIMLIIYVKYTCFKQINKKVCCKLILFIE